MRIGKKGDLTVLLQSRYAEEHLRTHVEHTVDNHTTYHICLLKKAEGLQFAPANENWAIED